MASEILPSSNWEHPGSIRAPSSNTHEEDTRFGNGSSKRLDQSLGEKNRARSMGKYLKDPTQYGKIQRRQPTTTMSKPGAHSVRGQMPSKLPPVTSINADAPYGRRHSDGDRRPQRLSATSTNTPADDFVEAFVFDSIPSSPMRTTSIRHPSKELLKDVVQERGGDSTTCEETKSASDNSSSLQSPTDQSSVGGVDRFDGETQHIGNFPPGRRSKIMQDCSSNTFPMRPGKKTYPYIPLTVQPRLDPRLEPSMMDASGEYNGLSHRRREGDHDHGDPGPPRPRYEEARSHHPRHQVQGRDHRDPRQLSPSDRPLQRHPDDRSEYYDSQSRLHESRSRYDDDGASHATRPRGYEDHDDTMSHVSHASRASRYHDDRYQRPHHDNRHHHHPRDTRYHDGRGNYDDDNMSHVSRSSNRRFDGDHSNRLVNDDVSRFSRASRHPDDVSHATSHYPDDVSRATSRHHHHHPRDHPEEMSVASRQQRYPDDVSVMSHSSRYATRGPHRHPPSDRHYDHDDDTASRASHYSHHPAPRRGRYEDDERSRYDPRGDDDAVSVRSSYSRYSHHHPPREMSYHQDSFARDQTYLVSRRHDPYSRRGNTDGRRVRRSGEDPYSRPDLREDHYGGRGSRHLAPTQEDYPSHQEDIYEAKMRAFGCGGGGTGGRAGGAADYGGVAVIPGAATVPAAHAADEVYVEIGPGVKARLRRTKETMDAIASDFYAPASCFACTTDLFCIADVKYIVCPQCKTISPAEAATTVAGAFEGDNGDRHGVGLGFSYDTLFKMQSDVVKGRKKAPCY